MKRNEGHVLAARRRPSAAAKGARRAQIEALRRLTPEDRVGLAIRAKELSDLLAEAGRRAGRTPGGEPEA